MNLWYFIFLIVKTVALFGTAGSDDLRANVRKPIEKEAVIQPTIPFIYDNKTISFKALINREYEGEFIYDTGLTTFYNLLSDTFCRKELILSKKYSVHKVYGIGVDHWVNVSKEKVGIKIGEYEVPGYFGIKKLSVSNMNRYDGLLNVHIFKDSIVEFDFNRKRVIFHHQFSGIGYQKIKIIQRGFVRMIDVKASLDNGFVISGRFLLDSGYWGLLALYGNSRQIDSLRKIYRVNKILGVSNFEKEIDFYRMECSDAEVLKSKLLNPTIVLGNVTLPEEAKDSLQGLVGNEFFKMFSPVIDFKRNIMYLKVQPVVKNRNMHELGMHLFLAKKEITVKHVIENSEAYSKGVRPNDRVEFINSRRVDKLSEVGLNNLLDSLFLKQIPVELEYFRGGKKMKVVLFH